MYDRRSLLVHSSCLGMGHLFLVFLVVNKLLKFVHRKKWLVGDLLAIDSYDSIFGLDWNVAIDVNVLKVRDCIDGDYESILVINGIDHWQFP
jgi:hypothetical protein